MFPDLIEHSGFITDSMEDNRCETASIPAVYLRTDCSETSLTMITDSSQVQLDWVPATATGDEV